MRDDAPEEVSQRRGPGKRIWISQPLVEYIKSQTPEGSREPWTSAIERLLGIGRICHVCKEEIPPNEGRAVLDGTRGDVKYFLCEGHKGDEE